MEKLGKLDKLASLTYPDGQPIVAVQRTKQPRRESFPFRRDVSTLLGRLQDRLVRDAATIVHVTSARSGEGVSTIARELAHAAATMPWCRPLLIDRNAGGSDQSKWFGVELPDLIGSYKSQGHLSIAAIETGGDSFHAARISPDVIVDSASRDMPGNRASPGDVIRTAYNIVIVDCPPVLDSAYFLLLARKPAEALLVVRSGHTRLSAAVEATSRLARVGCEVSGVVLNRWHRRLPRVISRHA
ncbi:MAG: hypothetical protein JO157_02615 [Acetobacteraceae bacterium]|nr:hypothetical protein [Acetobacteraceae bacterium]